MGVNTKYGHCIGCDKWVKRDDMLSINVSIYDESNMETRIPLRFCKKCHDSKREEIESMRWQNILYTEAEIQADLDLAEKSDLEFDPTKIIKKISGSDMEQPVFRDPIKKRVFDDDDSEAAMRRRGRIVDSFY